ncbi:O-methyltransferase tpcA [Colletotrichum spinosum]|uniref:O-methyltransferase tpcA n=1 Tax=Colletotrichum spinosum TaxID=1347390 RepID=A0A4R8QM83_9PEZI|nr:O-methyltransferase tpcA [Colletotrichum spinosum]
MSRSPGTEADARQLLGLVDLLRDAVVTVTQEWEKERTASATGTAEQQVVPSLPLFEAQRTIEAIAGTLISLVAEPAHRVQQVMTLAVQARALILAAEMNIPDKLAASGKQGIHVTELSNQTGIESRKLARIMRSLCTIHIFHEPAEDYFTNNRISQVLVNNEPLTALVRLASMHSFTSEYLGKYLLGPTGASYEKDETAFQIALGTNKTQFDWFAEKITAAELKHEGSPGTGYPGFSSQPKKGDWDEPDSNGLYNRPELTNFGKAMIGSGSVNSPAHVFDYPWDKLRHGAVVVDVGGGFALQMLKAHPHLRFVVQDRPEVIDQGKNEVFAKHAPWALENDQVSFVNHDFFQPNPAAGADIFWLRRILHDWSDEPCLKILSALKSAMGPNSRILLADCVLNPTCGSPDVPSAPALLPANYGYWSQYNHVLGMVMMAENNGIERTASQIKDLVTKAGLRVTKIWPAGLQLTPNGVRLLEKWDLLRDVPMALPETMSVRRYDGTRILCSEPDVQQLLRERCGAPIIDVHRADLQQAMIAKCVDQLGVDLRLGSRAESVDFDNGSVTIEDGSIVGGDVVLLADGLWSTIRSQFAGKDHTPIATGDLAYRLLIHTDELSGPHRDELRDFIGRPALNFWLGPSSHVVGYSLREGTMLNLVFLRPDDMPPGVSRTDGTHVEISSALAWDPLLLNLIQASKEVTKWKLI